MATPFEKALIREHQDIDEVFAQHQEALISGDLPAAAGHLETYRRLLLDHIRLEEDLLLPPYGERAGDVPGGTVKIFQAEHERIQWFVAEIQERLGGLLALPAVTKRQIITLLDFERMYKGLMEHHDLRERNILYPRCAQLLSADERLIVLATIGEARQQAGTAP